MVIIAPMVAPVLKIVVMKRPRIRINVAIISDCSSKNFFSLGHKILKAVVAVEGGHEFREITRVLESKCNRREGRTSEGIGDLIEIAPRLGVKAAAIGVKDADHGP